MLAPDALTRFRHRLGAEQLIGGMGRAAQRIRGRRRIGGGRRCRTHVVTCVRIGLWLRTHFVPRHADRPGRCAHAVPGMGVRLGAPLAYCGRRADPLAAARPMSWPAWGSAAGLVAFRTAGLDAALRTGPAALGGSRLLGRSLLRGGLLGGRFLRGRLLRCGLLGRRLGAAFLGAGIGMWCPPWP
jgi:hypothetical protein